MKKEYDWGAYQIEIYYMYISFNVLFVYIPAISELPQPVNVTLTSSHFNHMLKWEPGPGTPTGVYYHVNITTETLVSSLCLCLYIILFVYCTNSGTLFDAGNFWFVLRQDTDFQEIVQIYTLKDAWESCLSQRSVLSSSIKSLYPSSAPNGSEKMVNAQITMSKQYRHYWISTKCHRSTLNRVFSSALFIYSSKYKATAGSSLVPPRAY